MKSPVFLSLGEVMIRDTPADFERLERTRKVLISTAGSEFSIAVGVSRLGNVSRFITRLPSNPYGNMVRNIAAENGVDTSFFVWADRTDLIGRYLYELGVTPRAGVGVYQRKYSAASKLEPEMVDWNAALSGIKLLHTSGITLGLSSHSGYERNYLLECVEAASKARDKDALFGLDINYRGTLWSKEEMLSTVEKVITSGLDILITSVEDLAGFFNVGFGKLTAAGIAAGKSYEFEEESLLAAGKELLERYGIKCLALTKRAITSSEKHSFQSAVVLNANQAVVSKSEIEFRVIDRLGGGDAWASGFYTGIIESGFNLEGIGKGLKLGDGAIALQQTLMFDLPILTREEVEQFSSGEISQRVKR